MHPLQLQTSTIGSDLNQTATSSAVSSQPATPPRAALPAKSLPNKPIRLLLVDDHPLVREGLRFCLAQTENVVIVAEAVDGEEAVRKAKTCRPDLVLMDLDMPRMNGLTATDILRKENPQIKVLVLSMLSDAHFVMHLLRSGARGYVLKHAPPEELIHAIEAVAAGGTFFSSDVAHVALNQIVHGNETDRRLGQISEREREVLIAVAEGLSNKEVACRLGVGVRTIETHRERIMRKLDIHTVAGLTTLAFANGLLPLPRQAAVSLSP
jgi:two-component system, NarL family, nitrate/nitrite response regulator NarL